MRFPFRFISALEDATNNFEYLEGSGLLWGTGAPTIPPDNNKPSYYLRLDASLGANTRIYYFDGSTWGGIA